ncbi:TetR/AcrR family transcriptional regulator [Actinomadura sp. ATCC 31491]|uniref:TetR/AcrR family transcriptional regulator n=1 Tax=Actinomadura luzonensis TaxID=2805427 RepID=A0ABT0G0G1_9ACTN|nr:TetR/AcrR family transcriptional regulator [Actinomadura luzonensis]MCK2217893.1 TetR/AcrR family transcriptional regulator [Actinomadura luzonensis]
MDATSSASPSSTRGRNRRGQGERLRRDIIDATLRMLDELGDDEALSLRAVAREVGIAATSVYIHFADRDALVFAALEQCTHDLMEDLDRAESVHDDPVSRLRARLLFLGTWVRDHAGLYKVLHESTLNQRMRLVFKEELTVRTTAAVQRCLDAGLAPAGDAATLAFDLRAAVHGSVSIRVNEPGLTWPPLEEQIDRFLTKLVGVSLTDR